MKFLLSVQRRVQQQLPLEILPTIGKVSLLFVCLACLPACAPSTARTQRSAAGGKLAVVPVNVATVTQKTIPVQIQQIGNVQAYATVSVRSQVNGQITGVYFQRGQDVKKGQLLFTIDDRSYKAALQQAQGNLAKDIALVQQARANLAKDIDSVRQAQANLAKDQAQARFARSQANRYVGLGNQGAISKDQAEQYRTNAVAADATVASDRSAIDNAKATVAVGQADLQNAQAVVSADRAAVENAKVQLSYCYIHSPMDGRAGNILVDRGNIIQANSTNPLLTITQIHPIQVSFSVPERELPEVRKYMAAKRLTVLAVTKDNNQPPVPGVLSFVNNTVDNTTGTIQLLADFANEQGRLWPGQFVNVILQLTAEPNAIVVPSQAVQTGQNGQFVFVVKPNNTVELRNITVNRTFNGLSAIARGVQPGETVVTDGQSNLSPGAKIRIKTGLQPGGIS
jgi:multidrug efflux system membrane fusion protein